ncbi:MAG: helix-turn-helix transcriptional regulator [Christensenellaceae bacterium]|jgi:transcriptional regulator with XRE-family HTH domain|nr:helix-turn-helix transcriptional regulator [Christensenellaceae bacterium]
MNIKEKLGLRIRTLRMQLGMSQEDFAFLSNLDRTYITSIECGHRNISLQNLDKIANALKVTLPQLLTFAEDGG